MKKLRNLLGLFLAILLVGMFAACEGPAGPKGDKGDKGDQGDNFVNWEGYKEGIVCAQCHNPDYDTLYYVWARKTQWAISKHANGGAYLENSATCAPCHTTEGFIQTYLGQTVTDHAISSPIGCFACHSPHSRGEFSLRTIDPVTMLAGVEGESDYTFDYGKGNLCAHCHQPRSISPKPDPTKTASTDTITITSSRWYQHYGVQGLMLAGEGGFEFQGENYPSSQHQDEALILSEGCVVCHMAELARNGAGGHSMLLEYEGTELLTGCNLAGCHEGEVEELDFEGTQTTTQELLDSLETLLLDNNWITASGSVNASTSHPLKIAPAYLAGAMYNYFFVEHDLSLGIHNTKYAQKLLETSIAELTAD